MARTFDISRRNEKKNRLCWNRLILIDYAWFYFVPYFGRTFWFYFKFGEIAKIVTVQRIETSTF